MTPEDIESGDALAAWLRARPTGTEAERDLAYRLSVAIAHRTAMRVLPIILDPAPSQKPGMKEVLFFRLNLTAGVAAMGSRPEIAPAIKHAAAAANTAHAASTDAAPDETRDATMFATNATRCAVYATARAPAADAAAAAAYAADPDADSDAIHDAGNHAATNAATYAGHAADFAIDAGHASSDASGSFLSALRTDCTALEAGRSLERVPLWPGENPPHDLWARARAALLADGSGWAFWVDWYDKVLKGEQQDWASLLTEVALIPPEEWDKGAEHVNARIEEIRLKHAVRATPNAEVISYNEASGKFRVDPISELPPDHLVEAVDKLRDVLRLFDFAQDGSNQFRPIEPERDIIARAVETYADRPRMLHSDCIRVIRRLDIKIANGECPDRERDADIADFYSTVLSVSVDLFERDPLVREAASQSASARLRDVDPTEAAIYVKAAAELAAKSEEVLAEESPERVRLAFDPAATPEEREEALYVAESRFLRVYELARGRLKLARGGLAEAAGIAKDLTIVSTAVAGISSPLWLQAAIDIILRRF